MATRTSAVKGGLHKPQTGNIFLRITKLKISRTSIMAKTSGETGATLIVEIPA